MGKDFGYSKFELTLDQSVLITRSFYPTLSISKLFSEFGGAMGLWLGVGIIQMFGYCINIFLLIECFKKKMNKNVQNEK